MAVSRDSPIKRSREMEHVLQYRLHISDPIPFAGGEIAPNGDRRMFQPIASTLIFGDRDAVLVDPPMTSEQTALVAKWIADSDRTLQHIYVTHGHGDHWFGTGPLLERFPDATVFASPGTIEVMHIHASPEVRAGVWDKNFPDQIPDASIIATTPQGNEFELEGNALHIVEVGHTDTDKTTVLHVPSIELVVAGDAVYNGVHQYLVEAENGGFQEWIDALDIVVALRPRKVWRVTRTRSWMTIRRPSMKHGATYRMPSDCRTAATLP
jgi:glyoxylase-like metal-dependent hydrolase (beta-lactamase superfamily II)